MSELPIFYRSSGIIKGVYLPSEEKFYKGVLITDEGIFPASLARNIVRFFKHRKPRKTRQTLKREHLFVCWVYGIDQPPFYEMRLIGRKGLNAKLPSLLPEDNTFITQGIVTEKTSEKVILRVQRNPDPERTKEKIERSINFIEIRDCPGKVRRSQFWLFRSTMKDGYLHCTEAEILALAKTAKKYITK